MTEETKKIKTQAVQMLQKINFQKENSTFIGYMVLLQ